MTSRSLVAALAAVLAASAAPAAYAEPMFNRIASFAVADNLPDGVDPGAATSSEIVAATEDGNTLVYSDSPLHAIGFIDITDPKEPRAGGTVTFEGEPTSVAIAGGNALVAVNTRKGFLEPSGLLAVVDIATKKVGASCDLGGQPDSIALNKDKTIAAIAIENERDEDVNDGEIPQMPAGNLKILSLTDGTPDCATIKTIDLTGIAEIAPEDPEPEFVAFNEAGEIAVTLQENNHVAIVDAARTTASAATRERDVMKTSGVCVKELRGSGPAMLQRDDGAMTDRRRTA
ncbi:MAG TPA: hypothetical protein VM468_01205, partial [Mycoplana sp.]|nr:hypothetical protein [Mycoplana sp.]